MPCLNFASFMSKICFSSQLYHGRFLLKKPVCSLHFKRMNYSIFPKSTKASVFKSNVKSVPVRLLKSYNVPSNNMLVTFYVRHPIRIHEHLRIFHTSERRYFHPIVWAVLRPVLKFLAVITGRAFRNWWRDLPPNKKKYFLQRLKENKRAIAVFAMAFVILSATYYISHIEETPISKRKRFIAFKSKHLQKLNEIESQQITQKMQKDILSQNHPSCRRVKAIVNRIVLANHDIKEMKDKVWEVTVIDSSVENAFVLPNGHVFVFTGMLALCSTDDELGTVLSHEIAHCIQNHGVENASLTHLLDLISIIIIAAIWAIIPKDIVSVITHWLHSKLMNILFELPYNRKIETEADTVGLQLAAKACFDVRESSAFWAKMAVLKKSMNMGSEIEFLSTHPSHETRSEYLDSIMDKAIKYRSECGCPKLKGTDPRSDIEIMAKALFATRQKFLQKFPRPISNFPMI